MIIELQILTAMFGLFLSSRKKYILGNPFQIYFLIWLLVFIGYFLSIDTWNTIPDNVLLFFLSINIMWLTLFFLLSSFINKKKLKLHTLKGFDINKKVVNVLQAISLIGLPFYYLEATLLSSHQNIFSVGGYIALRSSITHDGLSFGILTYLFPISLVASSTSIFLALSKKISMKRLIISIFITLSFAFLSTGRTYFLLVFCSHVLPLVMMGKVKVKELVVFILVLGFFFILVAFLTSKGISATNSYTDNITSFLEFTRGYTIAPSVAFGEKYDDIKSSSEVFGSNTFRIIYLIFDKIGLIDYKTMQYDFTYVPDRTNVYTYYFAYLADFGELSILVFFFLAIVHVYLFYKAIAKQGMYTFLYGLSVYPLLLQFFQDQYFSLASIWLQLFFLYYIVTNRIILGSNK